MLGLLMGLATAAAPATTETLQIGAAKVTVSIPIGFCPPASPTDLAAAQIMAAADDANVTLATFVACGGDGLGKPDYYLIKSPKSALAQTVTRAALLDELGKAMELPQFTAPDPTARNDEIEKSYEKVVGERPDIQGAIKPLGRDATCVYMGGVIAFAAKDVAYKRAVSTCITAVGGKVLAIYRYSDGAVTTNVARHLPTVRAVALGMTE